MPVPRKFRLRWLATLALALGVAGCLDGERTILFQYDKTKDEFAFLTVYQHIREKDNNAADDTDYLLRLYRNRDHLIIGPFCFDLFSGHRQILRLTDKSAAVLNFAAEDQTVGVFTSSFDLNAIQILPGEFFQEQAGNLCYYHQTVIPGKTVDGVVSELARSLGDLLKEHPDALGPLNQELAQRASGLQVVEWNKFTSTLVDGVKHSPYTIPNPGDPLDTASLQEIREALANGQIDLSRRGPELLVRIRLTSRDVAGAVDCYTKMRAAVQAEAERRQKAKPDPDLPLAKAAKAMGAVNVAAADSRTLEVAIDLVKLFDFAAEQMQDSSTLNNDQKAAARRMADRVAGQVDVDPSLTVQQVENDFRAGSLASHPQVPEVRPGEGLIKPATTLP